MIILLVFISFVLVSFALGTGLYLITIKVLSCLAERLSRRLSRIYILPTFSDNKSHTGSNESKNIKNVRCFKEINYKQKYISNILITMSLFHSVFNHIFKERPICQHSHDRENTHKPNHEFGKLKDFIGYIHVSRIIKRLITRVNHKQTEPYFK